MALTKEDLQAIGALLEPISTRLDKMDGRLDSMEEQHGIHTKAITNLENKVMHELKLLNENLPDALAKREAFEDVCAKVDDHDKRIFALEQKASND